MDRIGSSVSSLTRSKSNFDGTDARRKEKFMALEDIKQAIVKEGGFEAAQIEKSGKKELDELRKGWSEKLQERKKILQEGIKRQAEQKFRQERFVVIAESKAKILEKKLEILDRVYQKAGEKLSAMPGAAYVKLVKKYISGLPAEGGKLVTPEDRIILLKTALGKSADKYSVQAGEVEGSGGFVYIGPRLDIDYSFGSMIAKAREDSVVEVSNLLFEKK